MIKLTFEFADREKFLDFLDVIAPPGPPPSEKTPAKKPTAKKPAAKKAPAKKQPKKEAAPEPDGEVTEEQLRKVLYELSKNKGLDVVKEVISVVGAKKIPEIPKDKFALILQKVKEVNEADE